MREQARPGNWPGFLSRQDDRSSALTTSRSSEPVRIAARAIARPLATAPPSPRHPLAAVRDILRAYGPRLDALEMRADARANRALAGYHIDADGRLVVELPGGGEESVGYLTGVPADAQHRS